MEDRCRRDRETVDLRGPPRRGAIPSYVFLVTTSAHCAARSGRVVVPPAAITHEIWLELTCDRADVLEL